MTIFENLKTALATTDESAQVRIQLGANGSIFQMSAGELMAELGVKAVARRSLRVTSPRLNIRDQPGLSGQIKDKLVQDTVFDVFDATPIQADNFNWQQMADGRGWVAIEKTVPAETPITLTTQTVENRALSAAANTISVQSWTLPITATQRGVGLSAGGWAPNTQQIELVKRNSIEFALICNYEAGQAATTIQPLRNIGVKTFILRSCTHEKPTTPQRFIDLTMPLLKEFADALGSGSQLLIAIANEPNLTIEGWGSAWADGAGFAAWWNSVAAAYRSAFPQAKLGFPALSPGGDVPGIRLNENSFLAGAMDAVNRADWIGVHYYWVNPDGSDINPPLDRWQRWFGSTRPIIGTEVGPADATTVTAEAVRRAYSAFGAVNIPACAWLLSGAGAWQNAAWDLHNILL